MSIDQPYSRRDRRGNSRALGAAALVGAGLIAGLDEIVFHQVLAWHSFYERGPPELALLSDGLLHGAELLALVAGAGLLADLLRRGVLRGPSALAGLLPYDLWWNGAALLLLAAGAVLAARDRSRR